MIKCHSSEACQQREVLKVFNFLQTYKLPILAIILLVLSGLGLLDSLATELNSNSITDAAIIYGVARSINAAISLIQSAELNLVFIGSVHLGELLDPINDLIERFSSVMVWSLSSLALQKVLLDVFGSFLFKIIFTIFCILMMVLDRIITSIKYLKRIWVIFLVIASLRFSIVIVCVLTAIFDYFFIDKIEQASLKSVQAFNVEISVGNIDHASEEDSSQQLEVLKDKKAVLLNDINTIKSELDASNEELNQLPTIPWWKNLIGENESPEVMQAKEQISDKEIALDTLQENLSAIEDQIACAELRKKGESCEEFIPKILSKFSIPEKFAEINKKIDQTIDDLITVLVSLVLTTIIFPLIFLYLAYGLFKFAISKFVTVFDIDDRQLPRQEESKITGK